ncbi:MAG: phosphatidylglycerophosphatase A [Bacteroidota bacterium]
MKSAASAPLPAPEPGAHAPLWAVLLATCGGIGRLGWAPGTAASATGLLLLAALRAGAASPPLEAVLLLVLVFAGRSAAFRAASSLGHRLTEGAAYLKRTLGQAAPSHPDPSAVVIDEVAGMWAAMLFVPLTWPSALAAFILFRLLDILKPFPVRQAERLGRGWGIMMDDLAAGAYANMGVRVLCALLPQVFCP